MSDYCCEDMTYYMDMKCDSHDIYDCPDNVIDRHSNGEFGIIIHDGGTSHYLIRFCPWCGVKL